MEHQAPNGDTEATTSIPRLYLEHEPHFSLEGLRERLAIDEYAARNALRWDSLCQHVQQAGLSAPRGSHLRKTRPGAAGSSPALSDLQKVVVLGNRANQATVRSFSVRWKSQSQRVSQYFLIMELGCPAAAYGELVLRDEP